MLLLKDGVGVGQLVVSNCVVHLFLYCFTSFFIKIFLSRSTISCTFTFLDSLLHPTESKRLYGAELLAGLNHSTCSFGNAGTVHLGSWYNDWESPT